MLTHIDLFSGIGGFALAAHWAGFETLAFVEIEPYAQELLKQNFGAVADAGRECGEQPRESRDVVRASRAIEGEGDQRQRRGNAAGDCCPIIHGDIRTFDGTAYRGATLLTGGFPCQPFSQAWKRRGKEDDRYLWPEMFRVIHEARPAWVLGENVAGLVTMELDSVLSDLEGEGYDCQSFVIPACAVDARHRRDRVWIVGHAMRERRQQESRSAHGDEGENERRAALHADELAGASEDVADGNGSRWANAQRSAGQTESNGRQVASANATGCGPCEWLPEPDVGGIIDGFSSWLDGFDMSVSHKLLLAYAKTTQGRSQEILRVLRDSACPQNVRESVGRPGGISPSEVLFAYLCQLEKWNIDEAWIQLASKETSQAGLRSVPSNDQPNRSSRRSKQSQQRTEKHPDSLQALSRLLARHAEKAWSAYRWQNARPVLNHWSDNWEAGFARVAQSAPSRVDRLKGLGNAIVPQVAFEIIREIANLELIPEGKRDG